MYSEELGAVESKYELTCTRCGARQVNFFYPSGAGLALGDVLAKDRTDSTIGRCLRCKRHTMEVTKVPEQSSPAKVQGFSKVPDK